MILDLLLLIRSILLNWFKLVRNTVELPVPLAGDMIPELVSV